jgi:hypothetical protein
MNDRDCLAEFVTWYLRQAAVLTRSTEAAAFSIHSDGGAPRFECISHLRPGSSSNAVREAAIKAFVELVIPCVKEDKNGVIELTGNAPARLQFDTPQYCLVVLIKGRHSKASVVAAFIGRYADLGEAKENMRAAALIPPPSTT